MRRLEELLRDPGPGITVRRVDASDQFARNDAFQAAEPDAEPDLVAEPEVEEDQQPEIAEAEALLESAPVLASIPASIPDSIQVSIQAPPLPEPVDVAPQTNLDIGSASGAPPVDDENLTTNERLLRRLQKPLKAAPAVMPSPVTAAAPLTAVLTT